MKTANALIMTALLCLLGIGATFGQASQTVNVNATIITGLSMTVNRHLNLGSIVPSTSGAISVTLDPSVGSARTKTGTGGFIVGNTHASAQLSVSGQANTQVSITLPASVIVLNGSNAMEIISFNSSAAANRLTLDQTGNAVFYVGGTINLSQNQAVGLYEGSFQVVVNY